jgi:hypothetical protein
MKARHTILEDIDQIKLSSAYEGDYTVKERTRGIFGKVHMITLLSDSDEIVAIVGGMFIFQKVVEVFALVGESITKYKKGCIKSFKQLLHDAFLEFDLNRIQIIVRADKAWSPQFGRILGFKLEGILAKYGVDGIDYFMFARVGE